MMFTAGIVTNRHSRNRMAIALLVSLGLWTGCGEKVDVNIETNKDSAKVSEAEGSATTAETGSSDTSVLIGGNGTPSSSSSTSPTTSSGTTGETPSGTASDQTTTSGTNVGPGDDEMTAYSPALFDQLLKKNVSNGRVDYASFSKSAEFVRFLQSLVTANPSKMSKNEQLAFWINAYNALVIKNVNDNPGIKQPLDVDGFFDKKQFAVAGKTLTLNDIENTIIRPTFKEPLIHFGLVCAAVSCPPLITKAYTGENVRSLLAENARNYLADSKQNKWDGSSSTLSLSKIFEWYKADFGDSDAGLIAFAKQYGPSSMKSGLESESGANVKFLEYDWKLNRK